MKFSIGSFLTICAVTPVIYVLLLGVFDYNSFIALPFWFHFSFCYLLNTEGTSICSSATEERIVTWTRDNWRWDLEGVDQYSNTPIPEIEAEGFSYDLLYKTSKRVTIPTVVRGLFNGSAANQKWSPDYFRDNFGDNVIIVLGDGRPESQYGITVKSANTATGKKTGYQDVMQTVKMKLSTAVTRMEQGEKLYIANIDTIFRRNNVLLDDMEFTERINPWAYGNYTPYAAQIFMGFGDADVKETTGTLMHCAASANLFVQVKGAKEWTFVRPRYGPFLYPSLGMITPAAKVRAPPKNVPRMHVTLNEGDVMLNPPWMWHEIRNKAGFNVGVATRENHPPWIARNNLLFSMLLEWRATPRIAKMIIPEEKKALRFIASIPFLSFALTYLQETIKGPVPSPLFTAAANPCDEHDRTGKSCSSTFLDKAVYSDDVNSIPFIED